jgi:hypothetical protein
MHLLFIHKTIKSLLPRTQQDAKRAQVLQLRRNRLANGNANSSKAQWVEWQTLSSGQSRPPVREYKTMRIAAETCFRNIMTTINPAPPLPKMV